MGSWAGKRRGIGGGCFEVESKFGGKTKSWRAGELADVAEELAVICRGKKEFRVSDEAKAGALQQGSSSRKIG
jgi:hypothetical protein